MTKEKKILLRPLEEVSIQKKGTLLTFKLELDNSLETYFKPGLYKQILAFLNDDFTKLCSIQEQILKSKFVYSKIINSVDCNDIR